MRTAKNDVRLATHAIHSCAAASGDHDGRGAALAGGDNGQCRAIIHAAPAGGGSGGRRQRRATAATAASAGCPAPAPAHRAALRAA